MCTYLVRARVEGKNMLQEIRDSKFITVGFPDLPNLKGVNKEGIRKLLEERDVEKKRLNQLTMSIHFFVNKMAPGDYGYLPDPRRTDDIYLIQVKSEYMYDGHDDSPHRRNIVFLNGGRSISRAKLPVEVRKALHTNLPVASLNKYHDYTHNLIQNLQKNEDYQYEQMKLNVPVVINKALESQDLNLQLQGAQLALMLLEDWFNKDYK